jgi:hypothetical protein
VKEFFLVRFAVAPQMTFPKILAALWVCVATLVSGCSGYAPNAKIVGQTKAFVIQTLGQPERENLVDGNKQLQFPRGPLGSHTYFVYLDAEERATGWEQVLTEARFNQITPGMTKEQVIDLIGISKITNGLARERGYVWHYRYFNQQCKSFVIEFTKEDIVRGAGYITRGGRKCNYVGVG